MLSATRQNTIMDTMLPAIAGDRRMSRLLAQLVFILAGGIGRASRRFGFANSGCQRW